MRQAVLNIALVALAAGVAHSAKGEAAQLRSVDIPGASRMEIPISENGFAVERTGARQVDVIIPGATPRFDLTRRFPIAGSRRIASARVVPNEGGIRLRFVLSCECEYAASVSGEVLLIEFRDPAATAEPAAHGAELAAAEPPLPQRKKGEGSEFAPWFTPAPTPRRGGEPVVAAVASEETSEEDVQIARQKLLEQLSRAVDQGLLNFSSPEAAAMVPPPPEEQAPKPKAKEDHPEEEPKIAAARLPEPEQPPHDLEPPLPSAPKPVELGLRSRTAVDGEFSADRAETIVKTVPCIENDRLNAAGWPDAGKFSEELARLSASLLDEFDNPSPDNVTDLTRLYILAGFGPEAIAVINLYADAIEDAPLLHDLALIVSDHQPRAEGPLVAAGPCSGLSAIWYRAADLPEHDIPLPAGVDLGEAVPQQFATLPISLRVLLGPKLMGNYLDRGDVEGAERIDLLLRRIPGDHGPAFDLARARLLSASHQDATADALYRRLARRNLPESQEALLILLNSLIARGAPIGEDLADALADAAFVARGSRMERPLKVAEIRARARAKGFPEALEAVKAALDRSPSAEIILRDAGHAVLEESSAAEVGPLEYVRAVLAYRDEISTEMAGDEARRRVAEELTANGLANAALAFLDPALKRGSPGVKRAAARAQLAEGNPEEALKTLGELRDIDAAQIRAKAEEMLDRPEAALAVMSAVETPQDTGDLAFRAGAWEEASRSGPPERRILAAFMAGEENTAKTTEALKQEGDGKAAEAFLEPPRVEGEVTLGKAKSVMDASREVRKVIEEALHDG